MAAAQGLCAPRGFPGAPLSPGNFSTFVGACSPLVIPAGPLAGTYAQTSLVHPAVGETGHTNNEFYSLFGQFDYDFGPVKLTVLPAYRSSSLDYITHAGLLPRVDFSVDGVPERSKATSVEVRLSRDTGSFKGVLGLYFFDEKQDGVGSPMTGILQDLAITQDIKTRSYAGFGQATISVTDSLRLIGGLRYTYDKRDSAVGAYNLASSPQNPDGSINFYAAVGAGACTPALVPRSSSIGCLAAQYGAQQVTKKVNWKVGAEFDVGPQSMLYITASTGLKAGGVGGGQSAPGIANTYRPESLTAFEFGSRNRFLNNSLQVNLEAFYYDYKDHQEAVVTLDSIGTPSQVIYNAGKGRSYGANLDVIYKPTPNDTVHFGTEYLNTRYSDFTYQTFFTAQTGPFVSPNGTGCLLSTDAVNFTQTIDCSGKPFTRAPKWTGVVSYAHEFFLGNGGGITAEANMLFISSRYLGTDYLAASHVSANQTYNASLTYNSPDSRWSLMAYVRNIGNEAVYTSSFAASLVAGFVGASINPPRTYGVRLSFKL